MIRIGTDIVEISRIEKNLNNDYKIIDEHIWEVVKKK